MNCASSASNMPSPSDTSSPDTDHAEAHVAFHFGAMDVLQIARLVIADSLAGAAPSGADRFAASPRCSAAAGLAVALAQRLHVGKTPRDRGTGTVALIGKFQPSNHSYLCGL
jgi:hypothetical protein